MFEGAIDGVGRYDILPLDLGTLTVPSGTPMGGHTLPVQAFLLTHPGGRVLFDTGFGAEYPIHDKSLRPLRRSLPEALAAINVATNEVRAIINCHLHYDHCGGNPTFLGTPIYVQAADYKAGERIGYYIGDRVDSPGADLHVLEGRAEVLPGLRIVPTPGHTPGHQSLVIDDVNGPVVIAGQVAYTVSEFICPEEEPARGAKTSWDRNSFMKSIEYVHSLKPRRVYFSHDAAVWEPGRVSLARGGT